MTTDVGGKMTFFLIPTQQGATSVSVAVDADHYIWVVLGGTGMVYRGRINRLGWN